MRFITQANSLDIELQGYEQIWALKSKITILKQSITEILFLSEFNDWRKWEVRLPGTGMPGKLVAGSFWTEEGWDFLYLKNPKGWLNPIVHNVLYIETTNKKYHRIIVTTAENDAKNIITWWKQQKV